MIKKKNIFKKIIWTIVILFLSMNLIAVFHSYKFTHFSQNKTGIKTDPTKLTAAQKIATLLLGINNPRPENQLLPDTIFKSFFLQSNKKIACWEISVPKSKGTVVLFHGYSAEKSSMLDKAKIFRQLGYSALLIDFMGSGKSEGNQTTIGFSEANQVKTCFDYLKQKGEKQIFLFGTSMGAVAIMKAISDFKIHPKGIIIECPFGSMYKTTCARFKTMGVPTFPMAGLLVFWGGIQNGFWAFGHKPTEYAKKINSPSLLFYGEKDEKVSKTEIDEIFKNLKGEKQLQIFPNTGHKNYLLNNEKAWTSAISGFLNQQINH